MTRGLGPALALASAGLLLFASPALAAPPANDGFANAETLGPGLPVEITRTNVEATKETEEPNHGFLGSKGHSVWFEWEATSTGFVTVGTCGSDFVTAIGVYTGTAVNALTQVAGDYPSQGPGCPSFGGQQVTFEAISGTTYAIAVDGDAFYLPPAEPPIGEGTIEMQIEVTPTPGNDDFVDAMPLTGTVYEEEAEVAYYSAVARGFNWNATKQLGEPEHAGDPGGASVWYAWTAPGTGPAAATACAGKPLVVGVYTGASLEALVPVGSHDFPCGVSFPASAGETYWIAVDGEFDAGSGEPELWSFDVYATMQLPAVGKGEQGPAQGLSASPLVDAAPPETTIHKTSLRAAARSATFSFSSTEAGSTFRCKLDKRAFAACKSPRVYKNLKPGKHAFRVAAVDAAGNVDPSPAVSRFQVTKPKARKRGKG